MAGGRPCKKCGMEIEFIEGPAGKMIPAQRIRTIYGLFDGKLVKQESEDGMPDPLTYVSHFETCPHAKEFSRKARK